MLFFFCLVFMLFYFFVCFSFVLFLTKWRQRNFETQSTISPQAPAALLATVWSRFHGDCDCCNGHQRWLAGNLPKWKKERPGLSGIKERSCYWERFFKNCKLVVFWTTPMIAARRKVWHPESAEGKCIGTKHTSTTSTTTSKCHQITSPESVFFLGCYSVKAGNADKGLVLRGHSLSSKKRRLCVCTYHKAGGIFDVWRKWIVERPVDILTKSFPFLKKLLRLLLRTVPSFRCENIPQCPGQWRQFSPLAWSYKYPV